MINIAVLRNFLKRIDFFIFLPMMVLLSFSVLFIYSAGVNSQGISVSNEWVKQIIWVGTGLVFYFGFTLFDYNRLRDWTFLIYLFNLVLLVLVLVVGQKISGARRWIGIGPLGVQPAELAKVATILVVATFFSSRGRSMRQPKELFTAWLLVVVPMALIFLQPDLGTALVYVGVFFVMCYIAGVNAALLFFFVLMGALLTLVLLLPIYYDVVQERDSWLSVVLSEPYWLMRVFIAGGIILTLALIGLLAFKKTSYAIVAYVMTAFMIAIGVAWMAHLKFKVYQWNRLKVFIDPNIDPRGAGWHILQSLTAIGAGGYKGRGYLQGSHSHNRYLPEQSTDFIFSIILEEMGFLGATVLLLCYGLILMRLLVLISRSYDRFGTLLYAGCFGLLMVHVFVNVGMVIGLVPITGVPLFLLSYGGSSVWTIMAMLGIVTSVSVRSYK
jgi:rod shape determining protein RodA